MGIFGQKPGQKPKLKAATPSIRVEKVVVPQKPKPSLGTPSAYRSSSSTASSSNRLSAHPSPAPRARPKSASPYPSSSDERSASRKRKAAVSTPRDSPAFGSDSDSDGDDDDPFGNNKRVRRSGSVDLNRKIRHKKAYGDDPRAPPIINAADLVSVTKDCVPIMGLKKDEVTIKLQYPSRTRPERYELAWRKDKIDTIKDIISVVRHVADVYLTDTQAKPFIDRNMSFVRMMERSTSEQYRDMAAFKTALTSYNERISELVKKGTVAANLDKIHHLPSDLVSFILVQIYERTVSPEVDSLKQYETGSDNVYGELNYPFVTRILVEQTKMTSDQVFVDLGSGVGNVVMQAALEIGCRSYGCEMMENACNLAEAQEKEFRSRCMMWGVGHGRVHLERGDFRKNKKMLEVLKEADVILVNNKAFTSELNDALVNMFLDVKAGCKIISLKSFVHDNKTAVNDVASSILEVEPFRYHGGWVSWAGSEGDYYISTKK